MHRGKSYCKGEDLVVLQGAVVVNTVSPGRTVDEKGLIGPKL